MGKIYDVIEGLKTALEKFRDPELVKWCLIETLLIGIPGVALSLLTKGSRANSLPSGVWALLLIAYGFLIGFMLLDFFVLRPRIIRAAMRISGVKMPPKLPGALDWFVLHIRIGLVNMFCWYDKKLLIPAVVLGVFALLAVAAGTFNAVAYGAAVAFFILAGLAWAGAMLVHNMRTMFAPYMFLRGDGPDGQMPPKSACLVRGQTLETFLTMLIYGIILLVAYIPIFIVGLALSFVPIAGTLLREVFLLGFSFVVAAISNVFLAGFFKYMDEAGPAKAKKK